jgi:enamine deaminase RidA (YjgF/YER057c/UK114 family)
MSRVVSSVVSGNGVYLSRLAAGGPFVFMASPAVDPSGVLANEASVPPPYHTSPSAHVRAQARYIWQAYRDGLAELGSSVSDVVQVEQYIQHKAHADGYLETSRGPGFMERGRPGSALICTGDFLPEGCVVNPTGIAVIPGGGVKKEILAGPGVQDPGKRAEFGEAYAHEPVYNEIVTAGPYVFTVGDWSGDYRAGVGGIVPEARAESWIWWGNEVRGETLFIMKMLKARLENAGTSLDNVVHATTFLIDPEDQFEFDLVWKKSFPKDPPARTVIPVRGLGAPRAEGARTHAEGAMKMESMCQAIRPGFGVIKEVVSTGVPTLSHESEAIRARPLLWISGQLAGDAGGLLTAPDTPSQLAFIFRRLGEICEAGGTSLDNLLRVRAFVTDVHDTYAVYAALQAAVPSDPPCVAISGVPGQLQIPGCTVVVDAVAYVPDESGS